MHSPLDWTEEDWNGNITTNLTGLWLVSKHVCIRMRDAKQKGSVINISSIGGLHRGQLPGGAAYSASKGGVIMLTKVPPSKAVGIHTAFFFFPRLMPGENFQTICCV